TTDHADWTDENRAEIFPSMSVITVIRGLSFCSAARGRPQLDAAAAQMNPTTDGTDKKREAFCCYQCYRSNPWSGSFGVASLRQHLWLDAAAAFVLQGVQSTFFLGGSCPAARSLILTGGHGPRARPAADARIALVVKRVVRHIVFGNKSPHILVGPAQERIDF